MLEALRNNFSGILISVLIHVVLIVLLGISFDWRATPKTLQNRPNVIKAVAVDANKVLAEIEKLKRADENKKKREQARIKKLKRAEQDATRRRVAEEKKITNLKKKRLAEEKKRKTEAKKLAKLKKAKATLEKKRKAELKKQRKAEQAKRKKAEAKRKQAERKQQLAEQLAVEEKARAEAAAVGEINKYIGLIRQKVTRNWLKPAGSKKGLACIVKVRIIPGGEVVAVQVIKSSGNAVFDRSVERAVRKASPLPLPRDPAVAKRMHDIDFEFIPEA